MNNKYALFLFYDHYPSGGLNDLVGYYISVEDAIKDAKKSERAQVVDTETWEIVWEK